MLPDDDVSALFPWLRFVAIIALICLSAVILGLVYCWLADGAVAMPSLVPMNNELVIMGRSSFLGGIIGVFALTWLEMDFSLPVWAYPLVATAVPWLFAVAGALHRIRPHRAAWVWNLKFSLTALTCSSLLCAVLTLPF